MKNIYLISGLGADERAFRRLDLSGYNVTFIKWITPEANETIEKYAARLIQQIKTEKPILIGLSFGGMMAIAIAKQIEVEKVILISSVKTRKELPFYFRLAGKLKLHKLFPVKKHKTDNFSLTHLFGISSEEDKQLLLQILNDSDPIFIEWAIDKVVNWQNKAEIKNLFHIHGTEDKMFPFRFLKRCDEVILKGGHFMVLNRFSEVNKALKKII